MTVTHSNGAKQTGLKLAADLVKRLKIEALKQGRTASDVASESIDTYLSKRTKQEQSHAVK